MLGFETKMISRKTQKNYLRKFRPHFRYASKQPANSHEIQAVSRFSFPEKVDGFALQSILKLHYLRNRTINQAI